MKGTSNVSRIKFDFAVTPLPEYKQEQGKDYVSWGKDNLHSDYLIDLYLKSPRHNSIINGKVDYIIGGGLTYDAKPLTNEAKAIAEAFIKFFYENDCLESQVRDGEIFNGVAIEIIPNRKKTKPAKFVVIPFGRLRPNTDETKYFYSKNWKASTQSEKETGWKVFDLYDIENPGKAGLFIYKKKAPTKNNQLNVFPTPNYQGGCLAIESDIQVGVFDNSNLNTGFTAGKIINFNNGEPKTPQEKEKIVNAVKAKGQGAENAGEVFCSFNNGKDKETTVADITPSDLDKQNVEVDKRVEAKIFTSHKITNPALFGIRNEGAISGDNNLGKDFELFQSIYVDGRQKWHEDFINKMAIFFGVTTKIYFKRVSPVAIQLDSSKISEAYTIQEVRTMLGLPNLEPKKSDNSKEIINAINSLSPLVANKVLESMSAEEIRGLVGLKGGVTQQMSSQESMDIFGKYGRKKECFEIIESKEFVYTNNDEVVISEFLFSNELSTLEKSILDLISKNEKVSVDELAKALKEPVKKIQSIYDSLIENEYLSKSKVGTVITEEGNKQLDGAKPKTKNFEIVYGYDWRAGFNNADKETSRDFCKDLMAKDLLYTRAEIDMMKNDLGTDVWTFKGGWYTKPNTDQHFPYCRHTWHQYLVKKK